MWRLGQQLIAASVQLMQQVFDEPEPHLSDARPSDGPELGEGVSQLAALRVGTHQTVAIQESKERRRRDLALPGAVSLFLGLSDYLSVVVNAT